MCFGLAVAYIKGGGRTWRFDCTLLCYFRDNYCKFITSLVRPYKVVLRSCAASVPWFLLLYLHDRLRTLSLI